MNSTSVIGADVEDIQTYFKRKGDRKMKKMDNKGFSLVELIIVIAIMAILIAVLAPQYIKYVEKSRNSADLDNFQAVVNAMQVAYADVDNPVSGDSSVVCNANGSLSTTGSLATALSSMGVDVSGIKIKSQLFKKNSSIKATVDASGIVTISVTGNDSLAVSLGLKK